MDSLVGLELIRRNEGGGKEEERRIELDDAEPWRK